MDNTIEKEYHLENKNEKKNSESVTLLVKSRNTPFLYVSRSWVLTKSVKNKIQTEKNNQPDGAYT